MNEKLYHSFISCNTQFLPKSLLMDCLPLQKYHTWQQQAISQFPLPKFGASLDYIYYILLEKSESNSFLRSKPFVGDMAKSETSSDTARPWQSYHTVYTNAKAGKLHNPKSTKEFDSRESRVLCFHFYAFLGNDFRYGRSGQGESATNSV